jgi:hypothetical protein
MMVVMQPAIYDEFMDFMTSSPTLEAIANYRLSDETEARISVLLEANRAGTLTQSEQQELDDYLRLEHMMRKAKLFAVTRLSKANFR